MHDCRKSWLWIAAFAGWLVLGPIFAWAIEPPSDVLAAVRKEGRAVVIVSVAPAAEVLAAGALPSTPAVARGQQGVLDRLTSPGQGVWRLRRRMQTVPLLVGEVDEAGLKRLAATPGVRGIYPDARVQGADLESARAIGVERARQNWPVSGAGVTVGMIDSGIDLNHPDLQNALVEGINVVDLQTTTTNVQDDNGHGTHVAGIITGDGIEAPLGLAPDTKLVVVKALNENSTGTVSGVIAGIDWIVAHHPEYPSLRWLNLSLVTSAPTSLCPCDGLPNSQPFVDAISRALAEDIHCIAAAGNDGPHTMRAPACFSNVISVGATYDDAFARAPASGYFPAGYRTCADGDPTAPTTNSLVCFSNRCDTLSFVAPGYAIDSCALGGGSVMMYGTSQSAAHVTAVLALLQQAAPTTPPVILLDVLHDTATLIPDTDSPTAGPYRSIDAFAALSAVRVNAARGWTNYR